MFTLSENRMARDNREEFRAGEEAKHEIKYVFLNTYHRAMLVHHDENSGGDDARAVGLSQHLHQDHTHHFMQHSRLHSHTC